MGRELRWLQKWMMISICTERILVSCVSDAVRISECTVQYCDSYSATGSLPETNGEDVDPLDILEERYIAV